MFLRGNQYEDEIKQLGCLANKRADYIGYSEYEFSPTSSITRGQFMTMLWKLEYAPLPLRTIQKTYSDNDKAANKAMRTAVEWGTSIGIVNGYSDGSFGYLNTLERQHIAVILQRYDNYLKENGKRHTYEEDDGSYEYTNNEELYFNVTKDLINGNTNNQNMAFSPYSMEVMLMMLKSGATGETLEEFNNVVNDRKVRNLEVANKLSIANAAFVKNDFEDKIKMDFINNLKNRYKAEYKAISSPEEINDWVANKTNNKITRVIEDDNLSEDFALGLTNVVAFNGKWEYEFKCENTDGRAFNNNGVEKTVEMMYKYFGSNKDGVRYIYTDNEKGVILPYRQEGNNDNTNIEFIALLPNEDTDVKDYVNSLNKDYFNSLITNSIAPNGYEGLDLYLPRFEFKTNIDTLKDNFNNIGIRKAFDKYTAEFGNISDNQVFIDKVIHKSYIRLDEKGTEAYAVTHSGMTTLGAAVTDDTTIEFNRPFFYMIREKNSGEVLFVGVVYEPNEWNGSTCE